MCGETESDSVLRSASDPDVEHRRPHFATRLRKKQALVTKEADESPMTFREIKPARPRPPETVRESVTPRGLTRSRADNFDARDAGIFKSQFETVATLRREKQTTPPRRGHDLS
jgi:hypothetical protein